MLWYGCDGTGVEPSDELPVLSNPQTSYDNMEALFYAAVTVTLPEEDATLDSIWTDLFFVPSDPADTAEVGSPLASVALVDDATSGDILPSDGVYARKFPSTLSLGTIGTVRFEFFTLIQGELYSAIDSIEVNLSVLTQPQTSFDKKENQFFAAITVNVPSSGPALDTLWTEMFLASGDLADSLGTDSVWAKVTLVDDGTSGDHRHSDNIYSREYDSPLPPGTIGAVRFEFIALVGNDLHFATDTLQLVNEPPVIISVSAADTLPLPPAGFYTLDTLRAEVTDTDGLDDIRSVSFTTIKPDGTLANQGQPFFMADNGNLSTWGDKTADDGIYSIIIQLPSTTLPGTYVYRFTAEDFSGAVSDTARHTVVLE